MGDLGSMDTGEGPAMQECRKSYISEAWSSGGLGEDGGFRNEGMVVPLLPVVPWPGADGEVGIREEDAGAVYRTS